MGKSCHKPTPRKSVVQTEFKKIISAFVLDACHDLQKRKRVKTPTPSQVLRPDLKNWIN